jgi:hypothetical protein
LDDIFATYFGCYGALLNVAVFPNSARSWNVKNFPKIIAMEPQVRELVQTSTESGELLTASKSGVSTTNSYTNTDTTKTGVTSEVGTKATAKIDDSLGVEANSKSTFSHEWGSTSQDAYNTNANASQDRSEKQSTSTQIQQLYNLLTGYHLGTNRAVFFMLPRPHMLPPTNRRTFVQGVRSIEGIQEFFMVISRPENMEGICVEARLDTGHFPEDIEIVEPPLNYKESYVEFTVAKHAENRRRQADLLTSFTVPSGWYVDRRVSPPGPFPKGDAGHIGISQTDIGSNAQGAPINYNYQAISDSEILISGYIEGGGLFGPGAIFNRKYRVYLRSIDPIPSEIGNMADIADLFITSRNLCCCFYTGDPCLISGAIPPNPQPEPEFEKYSKIVEQRMLSISESLLSDPIAQTSLEPAIKGLMRKLKAIMISSRNHRLSHFENGITFLDSDFFVKSILKYFPPAVKEVKLVSITGLNEQVKTAYGERGTVADALNDNLEKFILKTSLQYEVAVEQRRLIIGEIKPR